MSTSTSVCYSDLLGQSVFDYLFSITTATPPRPQFHGGERYITLFQPHLILHDVLSPPMVLALHLGEWP